LVCRGNEEKGEKKRLGHGRHGRKGARKEKYRALRQRSKNTREEQAEPAVKLANKAKAEANETL